MSTNLRVVMYHYVRDLPNTRFPSIKGLLTDDFCRQVRYLASEFEMATLETALAFLRGTYKPRRDLCLLTFDDGLKEHFTDVFPILAEQQIQGIFFLITSCLSEHRVATVHQNHFLTAEMGFDRYREEFLSHLRELTPDFKQSADPAIVAKTYRWDSPEVASFKYLFNFQLDEPTRSHILRKLFQVYLGEEAKFSRQLYLSWDDAKAMQLGGMLMGGHSHRHSPLGLFDEDRLRAEIETCASLLYSSLNPQAVWPFSYPYGKRGDAFNDATIATLRENQFCCGFSTEIGDNQPTQNMFEIRRIDTKDVNVS